VFFAQYILFIGMKNHLINKFSFMDNKNILLTPYKMGDIDLSNRICMAACTRMRCNPADGVANDLVAEYYT
jgi:2,4-dienoyl-CoA reductase-like NADH-dependent reductase (Old Yellow Enzyme family)